MQENIRSIPDLMVHNRFDLYHPYRVHPEFRY